MFALGTLRYNDLSGRRPPPTPIGGFVLLHILRPEKMAGMANPPTRGRAQMSLTILILLEATVLLLRGLHLISTAWTVAAFFLVIIPFATLKAFADFRKD